MQATKENHGSRSRATIVEVAERACVSIKTVSRVVNREPSVSDRTREKVEAAIAALDYRPNPSARGLAGNRSYSLGLLYQAPREFGYVRNALDGVMAACEAEGYALGPLIDAWYVNSATEGLVWDLTIAAVTLSVWALWASVTRSFWYVFVVPATFCIGVSCGLPLMLLILLRQTREG